MACNKITFETRELANQEIDRIAEYNLLSNRPRFSYLCFYCKSWHLTSKDPNEYRQSKQDPNFKRTIYIKSESEYWLDRLGEEPAPPKIRKTYLRR